MGEVVGENGAVQRRYDAEGYAGEFFHDGLYAGAETADDVGVVAACLGIPGVG